MRLSWILDSINAIALARCDREERCNDVGDGRMYANREAW